MNQTTEDEQNEEAESSGTYCREILFDRKTHQKIISKSMKIDPRQGFQKIYLDIFKWKNIQYFGTNIQEHPILGNIATRQVEPP